MGYLSAERFGQLVPTPTEPAASVLRGMVRQARLDAGMTQVELAAALGRPQSFVSKYESGERRLDVLELRTVCVALGLSFTGFCELLDGALNELR